MTRSTYAQKNKKNKKNKSLLFNDQRRYHVSVNTKADTMLSPDEKKNNEQQ